MWIYAVVYVVVYDAHHSTAKYDNDNERGETKPYYIPFSLRNNNNKIIKEEEEEEKKLI